MSPVPVQTVTGPISSDELGITLMHEHTIANLSEAEVEGVRPFSAGLKDQKVSADIAWMLREDPYACPDNMRLDDEDIVADEIGIFAELGGRTIVDNSTGHGRFPAGLVRLAERTGVNFVMGSGWSLAHGTDDSWAERDPHQLADELIAEHRDGIDIGDGCRVFPGSIGEIGVGLNFTASELVTLRAATLAQQELGVPISIHLPGWQRRAHEVLDIVLGMGTNPRAVILCHMDPSGKDVAYQREVADRGVWLEFDMIGMPNNFPGEGQSPSVEDTLNAVVDLTQDGYAGQLLLSQDMFLKNMWTRYGGNGYGFVLAAFLPRLVEAGVSQQVVDDFLVANPRAVFEAAAGH